MYDIICDIENYSRAGDKCVSYIDVVVFIGFGDIHIFSYASLQHPPV